MAKQEFTFQGKAKWAQLLNKSKYEDYRLSFYPADDSVRKAIKATGTKCGVKEDDDGFFYTFRSPVQPPVMTKDGAPVTSLIGNGSDVTIKLQVEDFVSPTFGPTARTILLGVTVDNLIPYEKKETSKTEVPA